MPNPVTTLMTEGLAGILSNNVVVTPTGGAPATLADALAAGTVAGSVAATTLTASGAITLSPANANVLLQPTGTGTHAIDNMTIGATTPLAGKFTTLSASGNTTLSPTGTVAISPSSTVTIAPTGALSIAPVAAGTVNNVVIGGSTPLAGTFTAATSTSLTVTGNLSVDTTKIGFYGTTKIVQQTGVAVTAAGIHAALVNLGLITA
jgi:hypothetical protein